MTDTALTQIKAREQLLAWRKRHRATQYDAGRICGIGRTRISLFENAHILLSPAELLRMQRSLREADLAEFFRLGAELAEVSA
jgi:hypothetical protein